MAEGWVSPPGYKGLQIKLRRIGDRTTIVGVRFEKDEGITTDDLRRIPLGTLELQLNGLREQVKAELEEMGAIGGTEFRKRVEDVLQNMQELVERMSAPPPSKKELRLPRTKEHRKPDEFYERLARLYERLVFNGEHPGLRLAEANGVPITTVHRWVREARARGFLPKQGRKGRAG